jgi:hypothetical protein
MSATGRKTDMNTLELAGLIQEHVMVPRMTAPRRFPVLFLDADPQTEAGRFTMRILFYASLLDGVPIHEWSHLRYKTAGRTIYTSEGLISAIPRRPLLVYHHDGTPFTREQAAKALTEGFESSRRVDAMIPRPVLLSVANTQVDVRMAFKEGLAAGDRLRIERAVRQAIDI